MPVYICYQFCGRLSSFCGGYSLYVGARVPFRGCFCICGRDKSGPYSCEQIAITLLTDWNNAWRIGRKLSTFAHEIRCEHTVRRRGPIHRARIYLLSILWVIVIILWGVIHCMWGFCICGRDKSVPYSCEQIAITLLTDCDNAWRTHTVRRTDCKYAWGNEWR